MTDSCWSMEKPAQYCKSITLQLKKIYIYISWTNWAKFCPICHIHLTFCQLTTTSSSISTTFAGNMLPQPAGGRKCLPRVHQILKRGFLCYRNKQTFLISKNMLIAMVPILVNKDVFEPYNDLKFMVQNCNYFCLNLIGKYTCARHFSMCWGIKKRIKHTKIPALKVLKRCIFSLLYESEFISNRQSWD